ncbi:hypothetical protein NMY22_g12540 [Coprinellus aureogranulatus]|nr:hypothetical protein NMY22_g12540 [Coprinellus aureogranulatus]
MPLSTSDAQRADNHDQRGQQGFLSPSPRLYALRLVIVLSVAIACVAIAEIVKNRNSTEGLVMTALTSFSAVHHLATAFGPTIPLTVWIDVLLTAFEASGFLFAMSLATVRTQLRSQSEAFLLSFFAAWLLSLSVLALLTLKALDIIMRWGNRPLRQYVDIGCKQSMSPWKCAVQCLFGSTGTVPGESSQLAHVRRALVALSVFLLLAFSVYQVIAAPIYDMGKVRYRQYRATSLPRDIPRNVFMKNWNMLVVWNTWQHPDAKANLTDAVSAAAYATVSLPDVTSTQVSEDVPVDISGLDYTGGLSGARREVEQVPMADCQVTAVEVNALKAQEKQREVVEVKCPQGREVAGVTLAVNFTSIAAGPSHWNRDVVSVYLGLTENADATIANTQPIFLFRGSDLVAVMDYHIRQELNPAIAAVGFSAKKTFPVASITQIAPGYEHDEGQVRSGPYQATLRFARDDFTPHYNVIEDYRDASIVAGFATVGGLGTFLSTLLVILLGTSLMSAVIRTKPYSPFGLLHSLPKLRMKMAEKCEIKYPGLKDDLKRQKERPGVLAFLLDTLIDLDALYLEPKGSRTLEVPVSGRKDEEQTAHIESEKAKSTQRDHGAQPAESTPLLKAEAVEKRKL